MWKNIQIVLFFLVTHTLVSQQLKSANYIIKVQVVDIESKKSIPNADVMVNGSFYKYSPIKGRYEIKAKKGDELIVRHSDFNTVYYIIQGNDDIRIEVESTIDKKVFSRVLKNPRSLKKRKRESSYNEYLDSAKFYKKKNIDKSLSFIEKTLKEVESKSRRSASFKVLADIYLYWKQYDLAIENYKASLKEKESAKVRLELAKVESLNKQYSESEQSYLKSLKGRLSAYEKLTAFEGLGDVFKGKKNFTKAEYNYKQALIIAKKNLITPKVTDLNSKLAEVFAEQGKIKKADILFQNSLQLANKENIKRSLKEEQKVADFYNKSGRFDDEIQLRKESLKKAKDINIEIDDKETLVDSITSQKINYKIGNAYLQKENYQEAIAFLEKSIDDADKSEDLIIKKDATRKLSEIHETVGDYTKALKSYQDYVKLVDTLYIKKEQEIQQVKRFSKRIFDNQNRIASLEKDKELSDSKINLAYKDQQLVEESNKRQEIIIYSLLGGMLLISLLVYYMYRNIRQQKLANNLLALRSMRSQMNPHFIFNALNSVNSFIAVNDERSANRYLSEFSVLMRSVLENSDEDFIPLSKEIELLQLYVKLEHNRFQDKFEYTISVDEKISLDKYSIPPMLLQPYIENAIWHGLRYKKEKGNLIISMNQKTENTIMINIEDDGVGRQKSMEMKTKNQLKQKSKGMSTIKNRIGILNDMYQDKISVNVTDNFADGRGTKVELILKKD
ncbi:tetratricopeptide repeat-containing sensor histidine kinase [Tenacibaculum halocynthiae]|uniref:tetratricopeptide repeat-containing sensor histidine kinase n=1 Tax=Tenacibaculum halocynthiae TaxID=1254437 RepID=UPI003D65ED92